MHSGSISGATLCRSLPGFAYSAAPPWYPRFARHSFRSCKCNNESVNRSHTIYMDPPIPPSAGSADGSSINFACCVPRLNFEFFTTFGFAFLNVSPSPPFPPETIITASSKYKCGWSLLGEVLLLSTSKPPLLPFEDDENFTTSPFCVCCCCCCCFFPDDGEEEEEEAFLLVKFSAFGTTTSLTFPLSLRLERVLMRRRAVEDAELLDDTNPEGDAKEEAISSYSSLSPVKCV